MLHAKEQARDPVGRTRARNASTDHVIEIDGERHLMPGAAVELLTAGGLGPNQAAGRLRRLTTAGTVRVHRLNAKLAVYLEADVLRALDELLDRAVRGR